MLDRLCHAFFLLLFRTIEIQSYPQSTDSLQSHLTLLIQFQAIEKAMMLPHQATISERLLHRSELLT